ncbi:MAG: Ser-Thr-rich GPI-anchored membrane family protein, partial [Ignavibacteria bacterium]
MKRIICYIIILTCLTFSEILSQQITVTSPNGGENWHIGSLNNPITWNSNTFSGDVMIELFKGGSLYFTIETSTPNDGQRFWDIPNNLVAGSNYKIKISRVDDSNIFDLSDNNFTLSPDEIIVTSPNGGENWQAGTTRPITWTDNFSDNVSIDLIGGGNLVTNGNFNTDANWWKGTG